jgi:ABC-type amino acid transport substrate-binding protein
MRRRSALPALAAVLALALAFAADAAAGTLDDVKKRGRLVAGVKTDFPPFGYVDAQGKNLGFDVELGHLFAQALFGSPDKVEFVAVTSGNRIPFLQSGKIDIIIATVTITDERRQVVEFSDPYFLSGSLVLVPAASPIKDVKELNGKTVAIIQGSIQDQDVAQLAPQASRGKFGKVSEALLAVKGGRADAYVHDDVLLLSLVKDHPDVKVVGRALIPRPYGIAVRKGDGEFIGWVNGQLQKMRADGTYDRLWKRFFGEVEGSLVKP